MKGTETGKPLYTATRVKSRKPYPEGIIQRDDGIVDDTLEQETII